MARRHQRWVRRVGAPAASEQEQQEEARRLGQAAASPEVPQASRCPRAVAPRAVAPRVCRAAARASEQPAPTAQLRWCQGWHAAAAQLWRRGARGAARWRTRHRPPGSRAVWHIGRSMTPAALEAAAAAMGTERRAGVRASGRSGSRRGCRAEAGRRQGGLLLSEVLEQDGAAAAARAAVAQQRLAQRDGGGGMGAFFALPRLEAWPPPLGEVAVR